MGTRNLTMAVSNNETKIAQYGQWDGYPHGQGKTILNFLKSCDLEKLKNKVDSVRFFTDQEIEEKEREDSNWEKKYPFMSRDIGGEILEAVYNDKTNELFDYEDFAAQSLFCVWAYVVDLDKNTLEVYQGFNEKKLKKNERFYYLEGASENKDYHPVKLIKKYDLLNLPSLYDFLNEFKQKEGKDPNHIL